MSCYYGYFFLGGGGAWSLHIIGNVMLILMFTMLLYAIIGVNLFQGNFLNQCYYEGDYDMPENFEDPSSTRLCGVAEGVGRACPSGYECLKAPSNPMYGYASFDNIPIAFMQLFQVLTLTGWTK